MVTADFQPLCFECAFNSYENNLVFVVASEKCAVNI